MKLLFLTIPRLALAFSGGNTSSLFLLIFNLWYFAISRKFFLKNDDFPLRVSFGGKPIALYLRYVTDLAVLREIFVDKEYDWFPGITPKIIIDLGAHFGDTALYYHARFPEAKIIAVEPLPENYERLEKHAKDISNIVPVHAAIGAIDGKVTLNISSSSFGHSVLSRENTRGNVEVPQLSLSSIYKKCDVAIADLVKFDIEGAEFEWLESMDAKKYSLAYIGELHFNIADEYDLGWITNYFSDFQHDIEALPYSKRFLVRASSSNEKNL